MALFGTMEWWLRHVLANSCLFIITNSGEHEAVPGGGGGGGGGSGGGGGGSGEIKDKCKEDGRNDNRKDLCKDAQ
ncbi:hypothetical protein L1987_23986 [Smallanthus sonchifolius]|uniref:Uncharacterized protein n=1 Tax=Smallanthus sonchifolius TaxID=185202 RepID=A0ACB9IKN6_9ASTR|nr:hypothetical protein L1987_23986 [Smallanthus sonchifolius]